MTRPRLLVAVWFLFIVIVSGYAADNRDFSENRNDRSFLGPKYVKVLSDMEQLILPIIKNQTKSTSQAVRRTMRQLIRAGPSKNNGQSNGPDPSRFRKCYFNAISCFKK